ncbi:carbohydrate ABC transporter permease [Cohnella thailandensis]|uniref:Carbohydrate ABC transporter permease n=1 Tax=Cohnella thailandensis TaxID=557557 RepID=A0A841SLU8_9BACL|nr:carbohydrate ABC transporter permease [Cohnella thailandensis]MBB6633463.1 carbohydrate ABC transporter permease [Cohnella thailandensis]MBP1974478.1 multiple sugar transport system permease protein [Cohnella thailandensis]
MTLTKTKLLPIAAQVLLFAFSILMLYPVLWMVFSSFKDNSEIFAKSFSLFPTEWKFGNYAAGWKGFGSYTFATFFKNSFIVVLIYTVGAVLSSAFIAYGFARMEFAGKKFWFACMIATLMLPQEVIMVPQYIVFQWLGWVNTFLPLTVPSFFGIPFFIFMLVQFMRSIPAELDNAAKIDGCNSFMIFYRIILPLTLPGLMTAAIFAFYWHWQDFIGPLLYLSRPDLYTVSLALKMFSDPDTSSNWGGMIAMSVLSLVPVIVIFFCFQRYIVEGITAGGVKG